MNGTSLGHKKLNCVLILTGGYVHDVITFILQTNNVLLFEIYVFQLLIHQHVLQKSLKHSETLCFVITFWKPILLQTLYKWETRSKAHITHTHTHTHTTRLIMIEKLIFINYFEAHGVTTEAY